MEPRLGGFQERYLGAEHTFGQNAVLKILFELEAALQELYVFLLLL